MRNYGNQNPSTIARVLRLGKPELPISKPYNRVIPVERDCISCKVTQWSPTLPLQCQECMSQTREKIKKKPKKTG